MKKTIILATILTAGAVYAEPILFNIVAHPPTNASISDFTAAGVTEDLTGAALSNVRGQSGAGSFTVGTNGVTLTNTDGSSGPYNYGTTVTGGNALLQDYLALRDNQTANTLTISGLSTELSANTDYKLYLWSVGDKPNQNATFTYEGNSATTSSLDPNGNDASLYLATFNFSTGGNVSDTLTFDWDRSGTNRYAAFNAFAIVPISEPGAYVSIPEPSAYVLLTGALSLSVVLVRRCRS